MLIQHKRQTQLGTDTICPGITSTAYSVVTIANASSYLWTLPAGMTGSGSTNQITVTIGSGFNGGVISVTGVNSCGSGTPSSKTLMKGITPSAAGTISGLTTICPSVTATTYSVAAVAGATSYVWTLPTGVTGASATNSITVTFGTGFFRINFTI